MKKPRFSTILFSLLLITGLGIMLYPKFSDMYQRYLLSQEMNEYNQKLAEMPVDGSGFDEYWQAAEEYNRWLLTKDVQLSADEQEVQRVSQLLNPLGNGMMGTIEIPSIDINLPIYQGTDEQQLQSGAGWWIGTSLPTGGPSTHAVITAHTGLVKAALFTDLDKLEIGDVFSLHILDRDLYYQVDQILVTDPNETAPLQIIDNEDHVTLYTCTPYGINTHRLLVRGVRIDEPEIPLSDILKAKAKSWWWLGLLAAVPLLLLLRAFLKRRKKKDKEEEIAALPVVLQPVAQEKSENHMPDHIRQIPVRLRKHGLKIRKYSSVPSENLHSKQVQKRPTPKQAVPKAVWSRRKKSERIKEKTKRRNRKQR